MKKGTLFVISAPSGTGKSTVVKRLCALEPRLIHSISCTTRPKRPAEIDGRDYHFISDAEFQRRVAAGFFAEWALVHGASYGTPRAPLEDAIRTGKKMILDLDVQGGMKIKSAFPEAVTIFLLPPSMKELELRLRSRGTDDPHQVELRLSNATWEMSFVDRYDHRIVNDDLTKALAELHAFILA